METLYQDIRFGLRMLAKNPVVTLVAVVTLALGIGANTAIFSTMNGLMLRPLPVEHADRLTVLAQHQKGDERGFNTISYLDFQDLRAQSDAFSDVLGYNLNLVGLDADGKADPIVISYVTGNYFQALGIKPAAGRLVYGAEADKPGAEPVVVLSYSYWKKRFNADPGVIGKQVKLNGHAASVAGVTPESFHGLYSIIDMQAYAPYGLSRLGRDNDDPWTKRDDRQLRVLGVLKPGIGMKQAQTSLDLIQQRLARQHPETEKGLRLRVYPERLARPEPDPSNGLAVVSMLFMVLAGLVLLLACTNVANIILVRAAAREREMAVRAALGAGRVRLVRQLMTESLMLGLLGGAAGLGIGYWVSKLLGSIHIEALIIPLRFDFSLDWRVFLFAFGAALLTGLLVGFTPAWRVSRANLNRVLHDGSRGILAGTGRSRMRSAFVVAQVAGSLALLVVAGLFVRSTRNAERVYLGFDPDHVMNFNMDAQNIGFDKERSGQFYRELEDRVRALPGVQSASLAGSVPMGYNAEGDTVYPEGKGALSKEAAPVILYNPVDPAYMETVRIPLLRGRFFNDRDTDKAPLVAVINEAMAHRFWPNQDALGTRFSTKGPSGPWIEIVGISKTGKYNFPAEDPTPFYYVPQAQNPSNFRILQVRTAAAPESLIPEVEQQIHDLAPGLPVFGVESMQHALEGGNGFFLFRIGTNLTGALGFVGLVLALVGVYGVISYVAAQRTHEIGVRMALGADRGDILKMVLRQGVVLVGGGVLAGLLITFAATRGIANLLVGVSPADPLTFALVSVFLLAVGLLASYIPARRAMNVEPLKALKYE